MLQSYKYGFLTAVRNKGFMFWTLMFPIILGTFFKIAFGSIMANTENFSQIPTAIVAESESAETEYFLEMIESISQGDDALIVPHYADMTEAERLLTNEDIDGIFQVTADEINLIVLKQGLNQSILKSISDNFIQISSTVNSIAMKNPALLEQTIENLSGEIQVNKEIYLGKGETDMTVHYYYALLAMVCLTGSYFGYQKVAGIQANLSPIAARRCISPSKKIAMILSDFAAAATLQFMTVIVVIAYLAGVLKINFGEQWGLVILTSFVGSNMGVSFGIFFASFVKGNEAKMSNLLSAVTMSLCFLSGLMYGNMKDIVERNAPIVNRINPAAILSDAYYALAVYDTYSRYTICIISMVIITALFCAASAFILGRKKYDSI